MLAEVTVIPKGQDEGKHKPHFPSWKQAPLRRVQEAGQKLMDFMAKMRKQERVSVSQRSVSSTPREKRNSRCLWPGQGPNPGLKRPLGPAQPWPLDKNPQGTK